MLWRWVVRVALVICAGVGVGTGFVTAMWVHRAVRAGTLTGGDLLAFVGALIGAAATVGGAMYVNWWTENRDAERNRRLMVDALDALHHEMDAALEFAEKINPADRADSLFMRSLLLDVHDRIEVAVELLEHAQELVRLRDFSALSALFAVRRLLHRHGDLMRHEATILRENKSPNVLAVHVDKLSRPLAEIRTALQRAIEGLGAKPRPAGRVRLVESEADS